MLIGVHVWKQILEECMYSRHVHGCLNWEKKGIEKYKTMNPIVDLLELNCIRRHHRTFGICMHGAEYVSFVVSECTLDFYGFCAQSSE